MRSHFHITDKVLASLSVAGVPSAVIEKLETLKGQEFETKEDFLEALRSVLCPEQLEGLKTTLLAHAGGRSYVAVVTVHGVGDQEPNQTARRVANLLLSCNRAEGLTQYTPFEETSVRVATRKLDPDSAETGDSSQVFMRELLDGYEGNDPAAAYDTIRLEGARLDDHSPADRRRVHVYDMFWADLSQLGSGLVRVLSEFFLLIFHIGDLGRRTAHFAKEQKGTSSCWHKLFSCWHWIFWVQALMVWLLTGPIVILNIYELAVVLLVLPLKLDGWGPFLLALGALAVILAVVVGKCLFRFRSRMPGLVWWVLAPLLTLGMGAALFFGFWTPGDGKDMPNSYYHLLALEWCVIVSWLLCQLFRPYSRARDQAGGLPRLKVSFGARTNAQGNRVQRYQLELGFTGGFAILAGAGTVFLFLSNVFFVFRDDKLPCIYAAGMRTFEKLFGAVTICWFALFVLILFQAILLLVAYRLASRRRKPAEQRAVWTMAISILHPTALVRVLTLAIWGSLWMSFDRFQVLPQDVYYRSSILKSPQDTGDARGIPMNKFGEEILAFSGTAAFTLALMVMAFAVIAAVWGLFPTVWAEIHPPRKRKEEDEEARRRMSRVLGGWLTNGYSCLFRLGPGVMFLAVPLLFLAGYYLKFAEYGYLPSSPPLTRLDHRLKEQLDFLHALSIALSAILIGLFSFRGPLEWVALGFHSAVRVALDVDNYMREFPYHDTPRAKISARYASLLRYLCKWRDPVDGRGYGAIVLIAHSQGSVITADLLRFLRRQQPRDHRLSALCLQDHPAPTLSPGDGFIPVYLMTVGSPLRQLYGWCFPHLYEWSYHSCVDRWMDPAQRIPSDQKPVPQELGLVFWVNAYRSGDYVGRYLWRPKDCDFLWDPGTQSLRADNSGMEVCIGAGAHTHYFDETAPEVAEYLDHLVENACKCAETARPRYPQ
ncbi:MAG: hypothetical protein HYS12_16055 [Planctomycetes bacterium]|nr:hypothetical protein [Planctomycetota bacterium]